MGKEPFLIILAIIVLFGLSYSSLKDAGTRRKNESPSNSSVGMKQNLDYSANKSIAETIKETERDINELREDAEENIEKSRRSPYYGMITASNISGLNSNDPDEEYITLYTHLKENEQIKITGWRFQSEVTGNYVTIGKAALLPFPNTRTESPVALQRGDRVYITKGFSPIGISFRTNKCTGYFEEDRTFHPSLPRQCPRAKDENLPLFSKDYDRNDDCLEIIGRIQRCTTKGNSFIRDLPDYIPHSCKTYITTQINYNTCVALHYSDTDFPGNRYYLYLNIFGPLWRATHDKINLLDENKLVVDTIEY